MNDETVAAMEQRSKPKSKRLSSFIWIVAVWTLARIFSELHPIAWEKSFFWAVPIYLGAFPVTAFLLISMTTSQMRIVIRLRYLALFIFIFSIVVPWFLPSISRAQGISIQICYLIGGVIWAFVTARKKSNGDVND